MPARLRSRPVSARPGWRRRLAVAAALLVLAPGAGTSQAAAAEPGAPYAFGTLVTQPGHAKDESAAGTKVAMLELGWRDYEPVEGQFNVEYGRQMRARLDAFRAAGMRVTLGLGLHYTPDWAYRYPHSRFVNQHGATSPDVNLVFNQVLRTRVERYLDRVRADLGLGDVWAVRLTSGGSPEVLYPGGGQYWAFDPNAQNGSGMPPSMPRNPFPGWKPGNRSLTATQVGHWADWYVKALDDVVDWQMRALRARGFAGYYQVLTPGSGSRPTYFERDVANYLPDGITGVGAVWHKFYEFLPDKRNVVAYVSSMADRSGSDDSCTPGDRTVALRDPAANSWSATRWISRIADEYQLRKNGENPGWNAPASMNPHYVNSSSSGMMSAAVRQMVTCRFQGMYWAHSEKLWDGTVPFSRYRDHVARVNGGVNPLPAMPSGSAPGGGSVAPAPRAPSTLLVDQVLRRGAHLSSADGRYHLRLQTDGNLVLFGPSGRALWANARFTSQYLIMQGDGNLVTYASTGAATWASNTARTGGNRLVVQGDGNVVVYSPTRAVWATNTAGRT